VKKIEARAPIVIPLSATPIRGVAESYGTGSEKKDTGLLCCKGELIVPDSLADYVIDVVTHLLRDPRFAGFFSRVVILQIDENYHVGGNSPNEGVDHPRRTGRFRRVSG
jgi:hypothetical protein